MSVAEVVPDAQHEAIVALHRAIGAAENGDRHEAETAAQSAIAWLRDMAIKAGA